MCIGFEGYIGSQYVALPRRVLPRRWNGFYPRDAAMRHGTARRGNATHCVNLAQDSCSEFFTSTPAVTPAYKTYWSLKQKLYIQGGYIYLLTLMYHTFINIGVVVG